MRRLELRAAPVHIKRRDWESIETMYQRETRGVIVRARPSFCEERSAPELGRFFWTYEIDIENAGAEAVQLISRRWEIADAAGHVEIVEGPGVVGEQPVIAPGASFTYSSGAPLATASGVMTGSYRMQTSQGHSFEAEIPAFSLDSPYDAARDRPN